MGVSLSPWLGPAGRRGEAGCGGCGVGTPADTVPAARPVPAGPQPAAAPASVPAAASGCTDLYPCCRVSLTTTLLQFQV